MGEAWGVLAAILSSSLGGMALAVTRFVIGAVDPVTLAAFRFGLGFVFLLPLALALGARKWPPRRDWLPVAGLGVMFFGVFFVLYNLALAYTTAARGALAVSVLPLMTMVAGALLGVEALTLRKTAGVLVATGGVALALAAGLADAPAGAWRGDLIIALGTLGMALYNVLSRPYIARSSPLAFSAAGMASGAVCLTAIAVWRGGFDAVAGFGWPQYLAIAYLGLGGGAAAFYLWVFALARTTPTRVAATLTVNPVAASLLALALLHERIGPSLAIGLAAVLAGIWIASTEGRRADASASAATPRAGRRRGREAAAPPSSATAYRGPGRDDGSGD